MARPLIADRCRAVKGAVADGHAVEARVGLSADGNSVAGADGVLGDEDVAAIGALRLGHDVVIARVDGAVLDEKVAARVIDAVGVREILPPFIDLV